MMTSEFGGDIFDDGPPSPAPPRKGGSQERSSSVQKVHLKSPARREEAADLTFDADVGATERPAAERNPAEESRGARPDREREDENRGRGRGRRRRGGRRPDAEFEDLPPSEGGGRREPSGRSERAHAAPVPAEAEEAPAEDEFGDVLGGVVEEEVVDEEVEEVDTEDMFADDDEGRRQAARGDETEEDEPLPVALDEDDEDEDEAEEELLESPPLQGREPPRPPGSGSGRRRRRRRGRDRERGFEPAPEEAERTAPPPRALPPGDRPGPVQRPDRTQTWSPAAPTGSARVSTTHQRVALFVDVEALQREARALGGQVSFSRLLRQLAGTRNVSRAIAYCTPQSRGTGGVAGLETVRVENDAETAVAIAVDALATAPRVDCVVIAPEANAAGPLVRALRAAGVRVESAGFGARGTSDVAEHQRLGREALFVP